MSISWKIVNAARDNRKLIKVIVHVHLRLHYYHGILHRRGVQVRQSHLVAFSTMFVFMAKK